jgi:hypothetical protein
VSPGIGFTESAYHDGKIERAGGISRKPYVISSDTQAWVGSIGQIAVDVLSSRHNGLVASVASLYEIEKGNIDIRYHANHFLNARSMFAPSSESACGRLTTSR